MEKKLWLPKTGSQSPRIAAIVSRWRRPWIKIPIDRYIDGGWKCRLKVHPSIRDRGNNKIRGRASYLGHHPVQHQGDVTQTGSSWSHTTTLISGSSAGHIEDIGGTSHGQGTEFPGDVIDLQTDEVTDRGLMQGIDLPLGVDLVHQIAYYNFDK